MKRGSKIAVIIVFIVVILFGVGQSFTGSISNIPSNQSSTSTSTAPATPATEIVSYSALVAATSTPAEQGSCWTNSIAAYARGDAWRCTVRNGISEPCFQIPGSTTTLLCGVTPATPNATSTF